MDAIHLLDCTLRDGSYVTEFQFTARDTGLIGAALETCGVRWIEIGHGLGMRASESGKGASAATDSAYLQAAAQTLHEAKWGVFFIPGIGREEDLHTVAACGASFVRIGANVNELPTAERALHVAKELGLYTAMNFMKSYAVSAEELACQAKQAEGHGADLVYVVDSAGHMLPDDVQRYVHAIRARANVPVGFHGHDNLSLAIANSLAAVKAGARWVDCTLQGLGRGAGNAATEVLVAALAREGVDVGVDPLHFMDVSRELVFPMLRRKGFDPIDVASGMAGFHSGFLPRVRDVAGRYGVDTRRVIMEVCKRDQIDAPPELVDEVARTLPPETTPRAGRMQTGWTATLSESKPFSQEDPPTQLLNVLRQLRSVAAKACTASVLNIVASRDALPRPAVSRFIQEGFGYTIASVEVADHRDVADIVRIAEPVIDLLLVDAELKGPLTQSLAAAAQACAPADKLVTYRDMDVWSRAIEQQVVAEIGEVFDHTIAVFGVNALAHKLIAALLEQGASVVATGASSEALTNLSEGLRLSGVPTARLAIRDDWRIAVAEARALVVLNRETPLVDQEVIAALPSNAVVLDGGIGGLMTAAVERLHSRHIRLLRPDMRAVLAAELRAACDARRLFKEASGRRIIAQISVVGGGLVGRPGEVVVDSICRPTRAIGVADGSGRVIYHPNEEQRRAMDAVERELFRRLAAPA